MDLITIFLLCLISCVIGAVLMLLIQYYAFVKYFDVPEETDEQKLITAKYQLPDTLLTNVRSSDPEKNNSVTAFNFIFQFLFFEMRNLTKVRKWSYRKLTKELDELITKTTIGKFFDKLSIREIDFGAQFPEIKMIRVHKADLHETEGHIENLDLVVDINYKGNFKISIDADMLLGKKGFLSVKVKTISGLARLQFSRKPYTHWSLCFLGDPELDLEIETQFQGRPMHINITSLISNQIRKAIRRKHTLPYYKLRYKPFFLRNNEEPEIPDITLDGALEVNISELSRLMVPGHINHVFCTLTLAPLPWVTARQYDEKNILVTLDLVIHKAKNQQIGIVFKQQTEQCVLVESIIPNTPATKAKLCKFDILISIEGKPITHINNISKIIKSLNRPIFTLRVERLVQGVIKNNCAIGTAVDEYDFYEDFNNFNISFSKTTDSVQIGSNSSKLARKNSLERTGGIGVGGSGGSGGSGGAQPSSSGDSSRSNTPTNSPRKAEEVTNVITLSRPKSKSLTRCNSDTKPEITGSGVIAGIPSTVTTGGTNIIDDLSSNKLINLSKSYKQQQPYIEQNLNTTTTRSREDHLDTISQTESGVIEFQQHSTIECLVNSLIKINDLGFFKLNEQCPWFNLNVFGRCADDVELLGYINIPAASVLIECMDSSLERFVQQYYLSPPTLPNLSAHHLSSLSGFDSNRCFGDVLLSFALAENIPSTYTPTTESAKKIRLIKEKQPIDDQSHEHKEKDFTVSRQHDFIRTQFQHSTQCDFCGRKIWLKDAVQCKDCNMTCHKKCVNKCQNSTICGPIDTISTSSATSSQLNLPAVEFKLTEADNSIDYLEEIDEPRPILEQHRQSFSDLISQGLKRVNSANNLAIPGIGSSMNQGSRSLPPSPQHSPRKQSLANLSTSPFITVIQRLEQLSNIPNEIGDEQICAITEPLIGFGTSDELMGLAKTSSRNLYSEFEPDERVNKINGLLTKLRVALDIETNNHANLTTLTSDLPSQKKTVSADTPTCQLAQMKSSSGSVTCINNSSAAGTNSIGSGPEDHHDLMKNAFIIGQSEERIQALSVIMLHLCTGLQYAQGVATQ